VEFRYLLELERCKPDAVIGVQRHGHLGDLIAMTGGLAALKRWFPGFKFRVFSSSKFVGALDGFDCVESHQQWCDERASESASECDLMVNLNGFVEQSPEVGLLPRNMLFGRAFGLTDECRLPELKADAAAFVELRGARGWSAEKGVVVLAPGSSDRERFLPDDAVAAVTGWALANNGQVVIATEDTISIRDLKTLVPWCSLVVTGDNGVYHLAEACRCPAVAVFGPVDPDLRIRYYDHVSALRYTPGGPVDTKHLIELCKEATRGNCIHGA